MKSKNFKKPEFYNFGNKTRMKYHAHTEVYLYLCKTVNPNTLDVLTKLSIKGLINAFQIYENVWLKIYEN